MAGADRPNAPVPHGPPPAKGPNPTGHADAEARRSVLTALPCATLVTVPTSRTARPTARQKSQPETLQGYLAHKKQRGVFLRREVPL